MIFLFFFFASRLDVSKKESIILAVTVLCSLCTLTPLLLKASLGGNSVSIVREAEHLVLWQHTCRPHPHNHHAPAIASTLPSCLLQLSKSMSWSSGERFPRPPQKA